MDTEANFRTYLQNLLAERCRKNSKYSLRAFAHSLEIHHAILSLILRNKRELTPTTIERLGKRLGLSPQKVRSFVQSSPKVAPYVTQEDLRLQFLESDQFEIISDQLHDAIIELTRIRAFRSDSKWMAKVLGVSVAEINSAVERLLRLGFLVKDRSGKLCDGLGDSTNILSEDFTNAASREYQRSVLEQAIEAIDQVGIEERDHTSITMAISSKDLPEAKKIIKECRRKLMALMQSEGKSFDSVYRFSFSAFPVTKVSESNRRISHESK